MMADCTHPNAILKRYVGSEEQYLYCPDCGETAGGEEGQVKRALIEGALLSDPGEENEPPLAWWEEIQVNILESLGEDVTRFRDHPNEWRQVRRQLGEIKR